MNISLADLKNLWKDVTDWVTGISGSKPIVRATDLEALIGEANENPAPNTLLERMKQLQEQVNELNDKIDALTDENQNLKVAQYGTIAKQYTAADIPANRSLYIGDESHTWGGTPVKAIDISRFKKVFVKVHNMGDTALSNCRIIFGLTGTLDEASSEEVIDIGQLPAGAVLKVQLVEHLDALIPEDTIQIVKNCYPYFIFRAWAQSQQDVSLLYTGGVV